MKEILVSLGVMMGCGILVLVFQFTAGTSAATAGVMPQSEPIALASQPTAPTSANLIAMDTDKSKKQITTASGLKYVEIVEGTGATPTKGQTVSVHYTDRKSVV